MLGINKVFRAKKWFSPLHGSGSGGIYRQNFPYRVFPDARFLNYSMFFTVPIHPAA
jgi:hypothetical protein